ncbi:hypothetical protein ACUXAV_004984 [Cupriavidus metallidurans]|jgi:hypothetical protein|nr:hypothetical protein C3Z06_31440 [Cupriavidus metallidurans]MCA3774799.1 hypothetical protein [Cutibacterium sp.]GMG94727.1 hypothetical protein Cmtc_59470 [Cupriavidus sp. TKC]
MSRQIEPTEAEIASYNDQAYGKAVLIGAMMDIGQTFASSSHHAEHGSFSIVALRTDHLGRLSRALIRLLTHMIGWLDRPEPVRCQRAPESGDNKTAEDSHDPLDGLLAATGAVGASVCGDLAR